MTVPATPVSTESATMVSMSTNVCAPQDIQVRLARSHNKVNVIAASQCVDAVTEINRITRNKFPLNCSLIGVKCDVEINECNSNPCMSGGTCVDKVNGFQCLCPPSTHGPLCLSGTDHCAPQPCVHGECIEQQHGYVNLTLLL